MTKEAARASARRADYVFELDFWRLIRRAAPQSAQGRRADILKDHKRDQARVRRCADKDVYGRWRVGVFVSCRHVVRGCGVAKIGVVSHRKRWRLDRNDRALSGMVELKPMFEFVGDRTSRLADEQQHEPDAKHRDLPLERVGLAGNGDNPRSFAPRVLDRSWQADFGHRAGLPVAEPEPMWDCISIGGLDGLRQPH